MLLERFNVEKDETRGGTTPPAQSERKTALFPGGSAFPLLTKNVSQQTASRMDRLAVCYFTSAHKSGQRQGHQLSTTGS